MHRSVELDASHESRQYRWLEINADCARQAVHHRQQGLTSLSATRQTLEIDHSEHILEYSSGNANVYVMSQSSPAVASLPPASAAALRKLGGDLAMARKRRRQSLKDWAARLQVSVPTLMRMEKGDPTVSMGVYATALWMINRQEALATAAEPKEDLAALEAEIRQAEQRHRPRGEGGG